MEDQNNLKRAQEVYTTLCRTLDSHDWKYQRNDDALTIECSVQGEDLPMKLNIVVDAKRELIMVISHIPFVIPEDKRLELAIAVSMVNNMLVDGSFDFDVKSGNMFFRMTSSYIESTIGNELFTYMIFCSCQTIDEYNDKFLMLSKGMITLEQFMKQFS